ncbi:hypothetical protein DAPPUDRAFT_332128 [Daphnia pulex]|uniref:Uncharacterized protein n=1 Tax=Daphnia pulex TaxID=6669 RepID=E9HP21_DAPPU|nr:hypothetical protein DAPPUDRAFT_332128 [Daphnia pulex]|eukprot:EFX66512.1 hypothetical protein DAPPUDRAFT_332128 [Daphnia pulex]
MIAALRLQLPTFVNETVQAELIEIEIEAGTDVPNYLLVPEFTELIAEADNDDTENNGSDSKDHVFNLDLESLLNENTLKYNETGYLCFLSCKMFALKFPISHQRPTFSPLESFQRFIESSREDCWCWSSQHGMIKGSLEAIEKDPNIQSKLNSCAVHAMDAFQKEHETIGLVKHSTLI